MSGHDSRGLYDPRPRDVPGFADAAATGRLPDVPPAPPAPLPGPTADRAFKLLLLKGAGAVAAVLIAIEVVPRLGLGTGGSSLVVLGLGLALCWLVLHWLRTVGDRNVEELSRGYTTLVLEYGMFTSTGDRRWQSTSWRVPWDYSGVWVLDGQGRVVKPPQPGSEPPGFYPSPNRPGEDELWTGAAWSGQYRSRR